MRFLFIADGSPATVFAVTPLATAARNAGHEILLAANEPLLDSAESVGLPAVSVTPLPIGHFMAAGRREAAGPGGAPGSGRPAGPGGAPGPRGPGGRRPGGGDGPRDLRAEMYGIGCGFARMASAVIEPLIDLTEDWPADIVVGGSMSYAAGLLATHRKIPFIRQAWDIVPMTDPDAGALNQLRSELDGLGLAGLPDPALFVDVCPPSLQLATATDGQLMRWIPINRQRRLEPWMYTRPTGRPRVLITSGTRSPMLRTEGTTMRQLVDKLALAGAEVLIAAPESAAEKFGAELADVRIGWLPLDVVAPTCDLAIHHGGAITAMTVMSSGVPQLIIPENAHTMTVAQLLAGFGAGLMLEPESQGPEPDLAEAITAGYQQIVGDPGFARQARALADEIASLPGPADVVRAIETLSAV